MGLSQDIKDRTIELGFDLVGITDASPIDAEQARILTEWLKSDFAGGMAYMHRNLVKRLHPAELLKNARSVIVVGLNYTPPKGGSKPVTETGPMGKVVTYARYEDYHPFIKERLHKLIDLINTLTGGDAKFKVCVDSAPVAERALAVRAGLGFIGKNHMLINPNLGCQIFLGEIVTDLQLQPDRPITVDCSECSECIEACPTDALRPDGQFDARRCINYLTIEHKGSIRPGLTRKVGDRLFGCEECIRVCPYQQDAPAWANKEFKFYPNRTYLNLRTIRNLSPESFEAEFADSVIKRLGLEGLQRNAEICLANLTGRCGEVR
jgi:epoxyqueuosine reductase